jgi:hypothetical protein
MGGLLEIVDGRYLSIESSGKCGSPLGRKPIGEVKNRRLSADRGVAAEGAGNGGILAGIAC